MNNGAEKSNNKPLSLLAFIIPFSVILLGGLMGGYAPFGTKDVMTAGGNDSYLTSISAFLNVSAENLSIIVNLIYIVLCSLAGLFFYIFLNPDSGTFLRILLSSIYALSIHMTGIGMNITFLPAVTLFPLVILGFNRIHKETKPLLYIIAMSLSLILSFETATVTFIFCLIYLAIPEYKNVRHFLITLITKLISDIFILGITCPVWINTLRDEISFGKRSLHFPDFKLFIEPIFISEELFSKAPVITFISGIILILFILNKHLSFWIRLRYVCLAALIILAAEFSTPSYLLSGFTNEYADKRIFIYTFIFIISMLAYETLKHYKPSRYMIISGLAVISTVISFIMTFSDLGRSSKSYSDTLSYKLDYCINRIKEMDSSANIFIYDSETNVSTPISSALLGYNYIIFSEKMSKPDLNLIPDESLSSEDLSVMVYRNPDAVLISDEDIKTISDGMLSSVSEIENLSFDELNELASKVSGCGDIFVEVDAECRVTQNMNDITNLDSSSLFFSFDEPGDYYVAMNHIMHLGMLTPDIEGSVIYNASPTVLQSEKINRKTVRFDENEYKVFISYIKANYSASGNVSSNDSAKDNVKRSAFTSLDSSLIVISILAIVLSAILSFVFGKHTFDLNRKPNRFEAFLSDNKVYFYVILLSSLVWLIMIMMVAAIPFGERSVIISDGLIEDYPTYTHLIDNIRSFNFSKVDYTLGYMTEGTTLLSLLYFINPLRLILLFFPIEYSLLGFNTLYAISFILTGPSMLFFLTHRPHGDKMDKHELKLIPIAMSYTLSSYVLCYMHFNGFLDIALFLPLIMYSMERMIYTKKFLLYSVVLGLYMILNNYYAFLLCEFLIIYFLTMDHGSFKAFIKNGIHFALSSILSAGIACFSLASFYTAVSNGGYTENDSAAISSINPLTQSLSDSLRDFEVMHRVSIVNDKWTVANTYSGLLCILTLALFICIRKIKPSVRIRRFLAVFLLYFAYGNELLNFIFHGFHIQSLVPNRFSIFFIFMMIIILYDVILNYKEIYTSRSLLSFMLFSCIILIGILYNNGLSINACMLSFVFILTYLIIVYWGHTKKKYYKMTLLLLFFLSGELALSAYNTFRYYALPTREDIISNSETLSNIRYLSDKYGLHGDNLVRTEFIEDTNMNTACLTKTYSTDLFSSTIQQEQLALSRTWGLEYHVNACSYTSGNPLADIMINVPYFIKLKTSTKDKVPTYYSFIETVGAISLYNNPYTVGLGIVLPEDFQFQPPDDYLNSFEYQNHISMQLIGKPLYITPKNGITVRLKKTDSEKNISNSDSENKNQNIAIINISEELSGDFFITWEKGYIIYLGTSKSGEESAFASSTTIQDEDEYFITKLDTNTLIELYEYLHKQYTERHVNFITYKNKISSDIQSEDIVQIYIPVPYYSNWRLYIDNIETPLSQKECNNIGGLLFTVPAGNHHIELVYETHRDYITYISIIISLMSISITIVLSLINTSKKRRS